MRLLDVSSRPSRFLALAVALLLGVAGAAAAETVATPDGRLSAEVDGGPDGDGGRLRGAGNVGAYHFDNEVSGGPGGIRITNPPMYGAWELSRAGLERGAPWEQEELYGPPVAHATLGVGGLTAAFTETGTLTNLNWPGPGYYDHVNYLHRTRDYPNGGAAENAGSFWGLRLSDGDVSWLTPLEGWSPTGSGQRYRHPSSGQLVSDLANANDGLDIVVTLTDVVHHQAGTDEEVLGRRIRVNGDDADRVRSVLYYANMNPTTGRTPRIPSVTDGVADDVSDFATVYSAEDRAMLHFRPVTADPAAATVLATGRLGSHGAEVIDRTFGTGVYVAVVGSTRPIGHQAGIDSAGLVRDEARGTALADPFYGARAGELSGSVAAVGKTAGAQELPLSEDGSATVAIAAADSAEDAVATVTRLGGRGFEALAAAADADWQDWLSGVRLPAADAETVDVARRALMLIRTAQDRRTGAIVANTTTQTPYRQDWLRDGAFFNYALLLAGKPGMVKQHNAFYRRAQTETGHWDPILCTDGAHCDAAFPFEIDAQAFGVWALWLHYEFTRDLPELEESWEAMRRGAEVLWACQDPVTGLQCYAAEDDAVQPTQGAQGAATVHLGLTVAAQAADLVLGPGSEEAARWRQRAAEIESAAHDQLCSGSAETGTCQRGRNYGFWPSSLYDEIDARVQNTLDSVADQLRSRVSGQQPQDGGFFQYPMEPMFALVTDWDEPDKQSLLREGIRWLTRDVVEPGVLHYGERIYHLGGDYLHTVGFPHIWSGAETYMAAAFVRGLTGCPSTFGSVGRARCVRTSAP